MDLKAFYLPRRQDFDGLVWHYTDAAGLIGIIEHHTLWATSSTALNDPLELLHGISILVEAKNLLYRRNDEHHLPDLLRGKLNDLLDSLRERIITTGIFVVCASTENDSLSNWRAYSRLGGYSVGISRSKTLGVLTSGNPLPLFDTVNNSIGWQDVNYDQDEQISACGRLLRTMLQAIKKQPYDDAENDLDAYIYESYATTIARMKHPTFADEREMRLFVSGHDFPPASGAVHHRAGRYGITPYLLLTGVSEDDLCESNAGNGLLTRSVSKATRLPIENVLVGPTSYAQYKKIGVGSVLASHGYEDVGVDLSLSPAKD